MAKISKVIKDNWQIPISVGIGILLWESIVKGFNISRWIFPPFSEAVKALFTSWGVILPHFLTTLLELGIGYAMAAAIGIGLATLLVNFPSLEKFLTPYILFAVTFPSVALVPILMLWFGFGITVKFLPVAIASGSIIMMNTLTGLSSVNSLHMDLMKSLKASRIRILKDVRFPSAAPMLSTGLILGSILGLITAVAAEFVGGSVGLGNRLAYYATTLRTDIMFAIILLLAITAIGMYTTLRLVGLYLMKKTRWIR